MGVRLCPAIVCSPVAKSYARNFEGEQSRHYLGELEARRGIASPHVKVVHESIFDGLCGWLYQYGDDRRIIFPKEF